MADDKNQKISGQDVLVGTFVDIALTNEQVDQAVEEEARLGIRDGDCAFLNSQDAMPAMIVTMTKGEK